MIPQSERQRVILSVVAVELGCLAVGMWIHHRLVVADVWKTAENEAAERLSSEMERMPRAVVAGIEGVLAGGAGELAVAGRHLLSQPQTPEVPETSEVSGIQPAEPKVGWLIADPQWRIVAVLRPLGDDAGAPMEAEETLAWRQGPAPGQREGGCVTGVVQVGDHRHVAVARPLAAASAHLLAHQPVGKPSVSATALIRSFAVNGVVAWLWGGAVFTICVYLMAARYYDAIQRQRDKTEIQSLRRIESVLRTRDAILHGLASLAESRDEIIGRHLDRVAYYSHRLAVAVRHHPRFREQVSQEYIDMLCPASMLHDLGKVGIEDWILFKPGRYTKEERERMQHHAALGEKYLAQIEQRLGHSPVIAMARQIALRHHERWDGKGYPDGLAGEQIPLAARIVALADVYDALRSLRDYKAPYSHEQCVQMIRDEAGKQFDPDLAAAFLQLEDCFPRFAFTYADDPASSGPSQAAEAGAASQCTGLVAAMQILDPQWEVPASPHVSR